MATNSPVVVSRIQNRRGTQEQFNSLYPVTYKGIGGYNPPGTGWPGFTPAAYPNVLMPGELAFCTDSRLIFMGNINGEFTLIATSEGRLLPIKSTLAPSATFVPVVGLSYMPNTAEPFITILYDLTDENPANPDVGTPGTNFSRNGRLEITAVKYVATPPAATLTDIGTEINKTAGTISFMAEYDSVSHSAIQIKYKHNFPGPLTFTSTSVLWQSL